MPDWSIKIVPVDAAKPAGSARFDAPGQTLICEDGDSVTWNNTTGAVHWPWPTDSNFVPLTHVAPDSQAYLSDRITKGNSSTPAFGVTLADPNTTQTFCYCCKIHPNDPNERGRITARPVV